MVYGEGETADNNNFICLSTDATTGAKLRFFGSSNGVTVNLLVASTATVFDSTWHHVCATMTTTGAWVVYIDGAVDASGTVAANQFVTNLTGIDVGYLLRTTAGNFFPGKIGEVANWSRTLSAAEAAQLAGGTRASLLVPDHYWPLLGIASPEPDIGTTSEVDGTLTGTTSVVGPPEVDYSTFIASLGRRPVPMIKGPDKDSLLGMRGNSF